MSLTAMLEMLIDSALEYRSNEPYFTLPVRLVSQIEYEKFKAWENSPAAQLARGMIPVPPPPDFPPELDPKSQKRAKVK